MATQKEYSIVINGIKESVSLVGDLLKQLDLLEKKLKDFEKKKINIKVDAKQTNNPIDKELLINEKLKTEEYQKQQQQIEKIKKENKELNKLNKDIAEGIRNIDGSYSNTLGGMRRELSDLKKELSSMDISDSNGIDNMILKIRTLNDQIKEVEMSYGEFGRNVGNYTESVVDALNEFDGTMFYKVEQGAEKVKASLDDLKVSQSISIDLGSTTVEFENLSQAIGEIDDMAQRAAAQMLALEKAGKANTEEYAKLSKEFQTFVSKAAELEQARKYSDELKDSLSSTTRGLDLAVQSFQAFGNIMQMASGISGLFGQSQEEIEKAINKTVQIMGIMQAAQEMYQQTIQRGTVLNTAYSVSTNLINKATLGLSRTFGISAKASKVLALSMSAIPIFALVTAVTLLISYWDELVGWLNETVGVSNTLSTAWNNIRQVVMGVGTAVVDYLINPMRTLIKVSQSIIKGDFKKAFDELGNGLKNQFNVISNYQKGVARETKRQQEQAARERKIQLNKDLLNTVQINEAKYGNDWKYTKKGQELYRQMLVNRLSLYKKDSEEYHKALVDKLNYERELKEFNEKNAYGGHTKEQYDDTRVEVQREIEDKLLQATKDGYSRRVKELKLQEKREYEDAKKRYESGEILYKEYQQLKFAIEKEYNFRRIQEENNYYNEVKKLRMQVNENQLASNLQEENKNLENLITSNELRINKLKKEIETFVDENSYDLMPEISNGDETINKSKNIFQQIGNEFKKMVKSIRNELDGSNMLNGIDTLFNKVDELKNKVYKGKVSDNINNSIQGIREEYSNFISTIESDYSDSIENNDYELKIGNIDNGEHDKREKEIKERYTKLIKEEENFQNEYFNNLEKYGNEELSLVTEQQYKLIEIAKNAYLQDKENAMKENEEKFELIKQAKEFELSNEELTNEERLQIEEKYNKTSSEQILTSMSYLTRLREEYHNKIKEIELNSNNERSDIMNNYHSKVIKEYTELYDKLESLREDFSNVDNVDVGNFDLNVIGSFAANIMEVNKFKDSFDKLGKQISKQKQELVAQFNDGIINKEAFTKSYDELNNLEKQNKNTLSKLDKNWKQWSADVANVALSATNMFTSMLSQLADINYENEMKRIEELEKQYDRENELLEEKFQEQEELYNKHNDNIGGIEEELKTARGDRRMFLLEQIDDEMKKRQEAYNQQQQIEKKQQQLEQKKKALELQKEQAEKKRNKVQQKVQIAQATASTALAVTNALAVQPWFLGVALAAVAAAMGAAQIAIISKQKFADGGILRGKSHNEGGIPVGNTGIEVEGNEYIVNKHTTTKNVDVLDYINSKRRKLTLNDFVDFYGNGTRTNGKLNSNNGKFGDGGKMPELNAPMTTMNQPIPYIIQDDRPIQVSVVEIENAQNRVRNVRTLAGLQ